MDVLWLNTGVKYQQHRVTILEYGAWVFVLSRFVLHGRAAGVSQLGSQRPLAGWKLP